MHHNNDANLPPQRDGSKIIPWALVVLLSGALAVPTASKIGLLCGLQKAVWMRVAIVADQKPPPAIRVVYNDLEAKALPVFWERMSGLNLVGVRPLPLATPLRLLGGTVDGEPLKLSEVKIFSKWERQTDAPILDITGPEVLSFPGVYRTLTLHFDAAATGAVEAMWWNQRARADLSSTATGGMCAVRLEAPDVYYGWVLLPPERIDRLRLLVAAGTNAPSTLRQVTIYADPEQTWEGRVSLDGHRTEGESGCVNADGEALRVEAQQDSENIVPVSGLRVINGISLPVRAGLVLTLAMTGLALLGGLSYVAQKVRRWEERRVVINGRWAVWLNARTCAWTAWNVACVVGGVSVTYHLAYALFTPMYFSPDSTGYYAWAHNLFQTHDITSINTYRTPGYPFIIALLIGLLGDQTQGLIVAQHLAVAMLGPLTVWFLYPRMGPFFSGLAGLVMGVSPIISIAASVVWTESLFCVSGCVTLLVFLHACRHDGKGLFLAGIIAGITTLIRPNGLILAPLMLGWCFLEWWCHPLRARLIWRTVRRGTWLVIAWLMVVAPWVLHIHAQTGEWDLTSVSGKKTESGKPQMNVFKHAALVVMYYHCRSPQVLDINRPFQSALRFLPDNITNRYSNLPQRHAVAYMVIPAWNLMCDDRFTMELFRENVRRHTGDYLENVRVAMSYSMAHITPKTSPFFVYVELGYPSYHLTRAYPLAMPDEKDIQKLLAERRLAPEEISPLLQHMTYQWMPPRSPVRQALLASSVATRDAWTCIALLALGGLFVSVWIKPFRDFGLLGLYWMAICAGPSLLGVGAERYAVVVEPMMYLLAVLFLYAVIGCRFGNSRDLATSEPDPARTRVGV